MAFSASILKCLCLAEDLECFSVTGSILTNSRHRTMTDIKPLMSQTNKVGKIQSNKLEEGVIGPMSNPSIDRPAKRDL